MRLFARGLLGVALIWTVGCAGAGDAPQPADFGSDEGKQIAQLVEQLNDDGGRTKQLKGHFASGSAVGPKEAKAFGQYRYDIKGRPSVSVATATATVTVEKHAGGSSAEKKWAFVKEGDRWKIKSAPLP